MSRCDACSTGLHCGLCACCPSRPPPAPDPPGETRTARLSGRDPLRLVMPTRTETRAVACPYCGAAAAHPCRVLFPGVGLLVSHHKGRVEAARRALRPA